MKTIKDYVTTIPDFPKPGILFRDVTSVTQDPEGLRLAIDELCRLAKEFDFDVIAGIEARGFFFGAVMAYELHKSFVPIRKKGKLPRETVQVEYSLEYGSATLELHTDAIKPGQKVLIVDDLLATGGSAAASAKLVEQLGGTVAGCVFLLELSGLEGRKALPYPVRSVAAYEGK